MEVRSNSTVTVKCSRTAVLCLILETEIELNEGDCVSTLKVLKNPYLHTSSLISYWLMTPC